MRLRDFITTAIAVTLGVLLVAMLVLPILLLVVMGGPAALARGWRDTELLDSLVLTALTALAATVIGVVCGSPVAYALARGRFRGRALLAAAMDLPLLIPHPVAGIALLLLVGRGTPIGRALLELGWRVVGTPAGIIAAMCFVSAPLYVSAAREAFARVDRRFVVVARTLGDPPWRAFRRVTLPLATRGLASAAVVMWSRAVSEFGAVVILAYNPRIVSVLSYDRFTTYGLPEALPVAAVLVIAAFIPLLALRALRYEPRSESVQ